MPPKPPLLRTATTSPGCGAFAFTWATMAALSADTSRWPPNAAMSAESLSGSRRSFSGILWRSGIAGDHGEIGGGERLGEFVLEHRAAGGVGARLEQDPEPRIRMALAQALHRQTDRRRVVGEVVDDLDAVYLALQFLAAGDAFEGLQALADLLGGEAGEPGGRNCHGGIADVELAGHRHGVCSRRRG